VLSWDSAEKYCAARHATNDNIVRNLRFMCWIIKTVDTRSEYLIIIGFPREIWFHESASVLRYTYLPVLCYLKAAVLVAENTY
jgi:hypothetical protein